MRRLILLVLLMGGAYFAGILAERGKAQERCETAGGVWQRSGFCGLAQ